MTLRLVGETETDALLRLADIAVRRCRTSDATLDLATRQLAIIACRLHAVTVGPEIARLHIGAALDAADASLSEPGAA